jgi:hypothetical protein
MTGLTAALSVAALVLASDAGAVDIKDKWGMGAGVFGGGAEVSLIRGRSERGAWLFDLGIGQRADDIRLENAPPSPGSTTSVDRHSISILAGPGYRRFTRPAEEFSPYWDVRVRGSYARLRSTSTSGPVDTQTNTGAEAEFSFGLEYFTRWHFSVAAHSGLARISWVHMITRHSSTGTEDKAIGNAEIASIGLSPVIFVRGYF